MNQQINQQISIQIPLDLQEPLPHNPEFDNAFQQAIAASFAMLGEPAQKAFFNCIEREFGISRSDVSHDPAAFQTAIEQIFGRAAAKLIEARIIRELHKQFPSFKYIVTSGELFFLDYVESLIDFL
ncbi:MAG TPA: hypothetical protein VMD05_10550 [Candidatus Nanoarchaeia archaeon]|nr:hypothetical protein [Candidatus Nanoarchaeia archaeon]